MGGVGWGGGQTKHTHTHRPCNSVRGGCGVGGRGGDRIRKTQIQKAYRDKELVGGGVRETKINPLRPGETESAGLWGKEEGDRRQRA